MHGCTFSDTVSQALLGIRLASLLLVSCGFSVVAIAPVKAKSAKLLIRLL